MKKRKNKKPRNKKTLKAALGTNDLGNIQNYIETPEEALLADRQNKFLAQQEAQGNIFSKGLGLAGGMMLNTGANMMSKGYAGYKKKALGGKVSGIPVEVEGEEVAKTPNGKMIEFNGPSHEQGGIKTNLPKGSDIFSKRIQIEKESAAKRAKRREKRLQRLKNKLDKNPHDNIIKNTYKRVEKANAEEEAQDLAIQEALQNSLQQNVNSQNQERAKFATGTNRTGLGNDIDEVENGMNNNYNFNTDLLGMVTSNDISGGNLVGLAGTAYSTFKPMQNTLENKAGDTPNVNMFKDYGKKALETNNAAKLYLDEQKDNALIDLQSSLLSSRNRNNNSARSVNTLRGLNFATDMQGNKAENAINNSFSQQMIGNMNQEITLENQKDQVYMGGEQARDLADRKDRDNFFSQKAQNITTEGQGIQQMGKMLNDSKENRMAIAAVNQSSKYQLKWDGATLKDAEGNEVGGQALIAKLQGLPSGSSYDPITDIYTVNGKAYTETEVQQFK